MGNSGWPPFDDRTLPDAERALMRDMALRRLVDRAVEAQHMHIFEPQDVASLKALAAWYRAASLAGKAGRWSTPLLAGCVTIIASWDQVVAAAKAVVQVFSK